MITIINEEFVVVMLFIFLDLVFTIKPKVPLLNGVLGLLSSGVALTTYSSLPLFPWLSLLLVALTVLVVYTGVASFWSSGKDK